ncbi:excalibur calcium-binding domain-containing protein [Nocardia puris]|uniref:Excalibur calcium-binding domain-containing protein n=1 Tax=Nocardia puris TaxID=208602 RepID=A0A366CZ69_9NOCA|nr:excalibur calcium-binding domain-containing protein [Nocardia puris]MBF6211894.1 excalibur calcium-binding domain-containing protein [Nocardia puris]MBF6366921.1 excalibur calcium-binding domain-containing protein [Nocardia puris]RBO82504.1 excalibur calcium-binding domain-containing protein [Nocardia puris]
MRRSRTLVAVVGLLLITVLVVSACGGSNGKRKRSHSSSGGGAAATSTTAAPAYRTCEDAWNAGKAPLRRNQPGYSVQLDRLDGAEDGVACLVRPKS